MLFRPFGQGLCRESGALFICAGFEKSPERSRCNQQCDSGSSQYHPWWRNVNIHSQGDKRQERKSESEDKEKATAFRNPYSKHNNRQDCGKADSSEACQIGFSSSETDTPRQAAKVERAEEKIVRESYRIAMHPIRAEVISSEMWIQRPVFNPQSAIYNPQSKEFYS